MAKPDIKPKQRGGPRPNSGRKPKPFTVLKRRIEAERVDDAEYGFALFVTVMRNDNEAIDLRLNCAREVMDRVLGKPKQIGELTGKNGTPLATLNATVDLSGHTDAQVREMITKLAAATIMPTQLHQTDESNPPNTAPTGS